MGVEGNKAIIEEFYEASMRGNMDICFALLADDIKWTNIGSTKFSGTFVGKQVLIEQLLGPLFGQLKAGISSVVENIIAEGEYVVVQTAGTAETMGGVSYNNSYCHIFKIREGQIAEVKEYFDTELTSSVFGH